MKPPGGCQGSALSLLGPWGQACPQHSGVRANASREAAARQCPESLQILSPAGCPHHGAQR